MGYIESMERQERKVTDSFTALDPEGNPVKIYEFAEELRVETSSGSGIVKTHRHYMTEDRRVVTKVRGSRKEFDIIDNPVIPVKRED
jgi:hypothetical protein